MADITVLSLHCVTTADIHENSHLQRVSIAKGNNFAFLYRTCTADDERVSDWIVGMIRAWNAIVTQEICDIK